MAQGKKIWQITNKILKKNSDGEKERMTLRDKSGNVINQNQNSLFSIFFEELVKKINDNS